ncbi:hypothetical protein GFV14_00558 [Candidatus Hartigia pinicola]|nr:hypothetical protein GFV14_00558 [Candidatus Hartigia pinicola]
MINWPFLTILFSGWLYIDAAYRGPNWKRWFFRPITLLLLFLWGWSADFLATKDYFSLTALIISLLSDIQMMLLREHSITPVYLMFVSHLLYTISFSIQLKFSLYLPWILLSLIIATITLAIIWSKLKDRQTIIFSLVMMSMIMSWVAGEQFFSLSHDYNFSIMIGAFLLFISNCVWLISRFTFSFKASKAIVATLYFFGKFFIIRAIQL